MNTSHMILARVNCKVSTLEEKPHPSPLPQPPTSPPLPRTQAQAEDRDIS